MNSEDPEDPKNPKVQYFKSTDLSISTLSFRAPCFSNQGEVLPGQDNLNMAKKLRIPFQLLWSSVTHRKFGSDFQRKGLMSAEERCVCIQCKGDTLASTCVLLPVINYLLPFIVFLQCTE